MALSRIFRDDPFFGPVPHVFEDLPNVFNTLAHPASRQVAVPNIQLDIQETDTQYKIHADLPGLNKEDIAIDFDQGILKITAERKMEKKEDNDKWHVSERHYGRVSRSIRLPSDVDAERIAASYDAGVLDVIAPKLQKTANGRTNIKVQ